MTLSILQLNSNGDNYWDLLIPFLIAHDFDIIQLQEVTGKGTICGNINCTRDCFEELQHILSDRYHGELVIAQKYASSLTSYMGNATFYKKSFSLLDKKTLTLHPQESPLPSTLTDFSIVGRKLLHLTLKKDDTTISFLNTHGAWARRSTQHPHQTKQAEILIKYLKTVPSPFVFSADLNLNPQQIAIQTLSSFTRNLITEHHITNTLNPRLHSARVLFPPGVAVDYIFVDKNIKVEQFGVIEEDLSDHLGLHATVTI